MKAKSKLKIPVYRYPSKSAEKFLHKLFSRYSAIPVKIERYVYKLYTKVLKEREKALLELTEKFDGCKFSELDEFRVRETEIEKAYKEISSELLQAIKRAIQNVELFHRRGLPFSWFEKREEGVIFGTKVEPVERVGIYIPGGKGGETPLISTVIMTAVPAKIAGVRKIVMISPPRKNGSLHPALLVAARECSVHEIYKIGGPWGIFALAEGIFPLPKVDLICGPGNIYVTTAKKIVSSFTGIDLIAGPSEVLILADETANPEYVVWDLFAQAEHDPMSLSLLITPSARLIREVKSLIIEEIEKTERKEVIKEALRKGGIIKVSSLEEGVEIANKIAPEHLELCVKEPFLLLQEVKNAGAVFLGNHTPEAVGDYIGGPNHVLPTMGFARFSSALSVEKFLKKINFLYYSKEALFREGEFITKLAETENLDAHAKAVKVRLKDRS